ncbi:MAG: ParB/RepB/Spo0J family partition protein [Paracoccaceae bacterium]
MAKRRRLSAPDASELEELEAGFAAKPSANPFETKAMTPPIAQVAGEAAALAGMASVTDRVALAQDQGDAVRWREASESGLVAEEIPLDQIDPDYIRRDRMVEDEEAMEELIASLRVHGLRTPLEVTRSDEGYGLISGYRRLQAFRRLADEDPQFEHIPAFVRVAGAGQGAYVAMVEENELRSDLTHYERGRIAVLAVGQGVFESVEEAVDTLFAAASKAKRSKVRSFAAVHEGLGDLLKFPVALGERPGLRLASAIRDGAQAQLRAALSGADVMDAKDEWKVLEQVLKGAPKPARDPARGGRPSEVTKLKGREVPGGGMLSAEITSDGFRMQLSGREIAPNRLERLLVRLAKEIG